MKIFNVIQLCILVSVYSISILGCAGMMPADLNAQKEFTYDFLVKGKSQTELWRNAQYFFAENYGDSRAVFRVNDEKDGTIIGRGSAPWTLNAFAPTCYTDYHIRFAVKNEKARLQLELIEGVPPGSPCSAWPWPTTDGYEQIVSSLKGAAQRLDAALKGDAPATKFKNF